jgi:hypothetical protein
MRVLKHYLNNPDIITSVSNFLNNLICKCPNNRMKELMSTELLDALRFSYEEGTYESKENCIICLWSLTSKAYDKQLLELVGSKYISIMLHIFQYETDFISLVIENAVSPVVFCYNSLLSY